MTYNPFADLFKNSLDFNQIFSSQRRNIEACSEAYQGMVENAQAVCRRGAEITRENVETTLKASKDLMTGSPDVNLGKNTEFARSLFESTLSNLREVGEMITKSSFEAFDVLNKRAAESLDEMSKTASSGYGNASKKKTA